jgi:hypothetical protein
MNNDNKNLIAIIACLISLLGIFITSIVSIKLEKEQFESNLIVKAVENDDIEVSKRNLRFLIESGIVSRENKKIKKLLSNDTILEIVLPNTVKIKSGPLNDFSINEYALFSSRIIDNKNNSLKDVEVVVYKKNSNSDTTLFSSTLSDSNGLFSLPVPNENNIFKYCLKKKGYKTTCKFISKNQKFKSIVLHK